MPLLWAYEYSVYCWIVRLMLREKRVEFEIREINPFLPEEKARLEKINPFGNVPVLEDAGQIIFETSDIIRYVDTNYSGPNFSLADTAQRALQDQIIAVADKHAYWPWVRQVFANAVFAPNFGEPVDRQTLETGFKNSLPVLHMLEALAADDQFLCGNRICLADIHLFPMLAYLAKAPEGREMLESSPKLFHWFEHMTDRASVRETEPVI